LTRSQVRRVGGHRLQGSPENEFPLCPAGAAGARSIRAASVLSPCVHRRARTVGCGYPMRARRRSTPLGIFSDLDRRLSATREHQRPLRRRPGPGLLPRPSTRPDRRTPPRRTCWPSPTPSPGRPTRGASAARSQAARCFAGQRLQSSRQPLRQDTEHLRGETLSLPARGRRGQAKAPAEAAVEIR
jgi:hypothetical protein